MEEEGLIPLHEADPDLEANHWEHVADCGCCGPLVKVKGIRKTHYFLRHWDCAPGMPIFVSVLFIYTLFVHIIYVDRLLPIFGALISTILVLLFGIMFIWSYFAAVCMDPGFLPYNWTKTRRFWYSWQEQLNGIAMTREQVSFAKAPENRPPGCSFSGTAGRYVIRADHICGWIANWVGKRNHKQFMLLNFWGFLYTITLFSSFWFQTVPIEKLGLTTLLLEVTAGVFELSFMCILFMMGTASLCDLMKHRTKIQRMRNEQNDTDEFTCEESMRVICGSSSKCMWFIPTPAFDQTLVITEEDEQSSAEDE